MHCGTGIPLVENNAVTGRTTHQQAGLLLGPAFAALMMMMGPPEDLSIAAWHTAAMGVLMATWWATEAVPIAITALTPIVMFPLLGIATIQQATSPFANKVVYLFLGGFMVAFAMQRWNLHRRMALTVLQYAGGNGRMLVGGFMLASALLSMWVMNTSTTMMLLPIAVSVVNVIHGTVQDLNDEQKKSFQYALLLGVAYASSIGGMATLVGTAPNAMLAAFMQETYAVEIDFASWMLVGIPVSLVLLPIAWLVLTRFVFKVDFQNSSEGIQLLKTMKEDMGKITTPETRVAVVFVLMASLWMLRPLLVKVPGLEALDDTGIAMVGGIVLFLIPSGDKSDPLLLRWQYVEKLPWGILILFGGGLSLASAVSRTGLAEWLGNNLQFITTLPVPILVLITAGLIVFLTELTSNIGTTATFMPVVGAIAIEAGVDPLILLVPVVIAASCAFMLPVATPPNAIVFGSGLLTIPKMMRAGIALNLIAIVVVSVIGLNLAPRFLGG